MNDWAGWSQEKKAEVRRIKAMTIHQRMDDKSILSDNGCLVWTGLKDRCDYGKISYKSEYYRVHRLKWILKHGLPENNLKVLHKCDNPACSNLEHLFLGTQDDNMKDMASKGRGRGKSSEYRMSANG